jgi:hypothetical protein
MDVRLADLAGIVSAKTELADYPQASSVEQNVLVYDGERLRGEVADPGSRRRARGVGRAAAELTGLC